MESWGAAGVESWEEASAECRGAGSVEFWEGAGQKAGQDSQNHWEGQQGIPGVGGAGAQDLLGRWGGREGVGPVTSASPNGRTEARGRGHEAGRVESLRSVPGEQSSAGSGQEPEPLGHLLARPADRRTQSGPQAPARAHSHPGPPMARAAALPPSRSLPTLPLLPLLLMLLPETGERPQALLALRGPNPSPPSEWG